MRKKYLLSVVAIVLISLATYGLVELDKLQNAGDFGEKNSNIDSNIDRLDVSGLPMFAQKTVRVEEAYAFAVQNPDQFAYIACYCGCGNMQHSDRLIQHGSLKDCYLMPDGNFEPHASNCKACIDIALDAKELLEKGYSLKEVRAAIDEAYSGRGIGTDTPLPQ